MPLQVKLVLCRFGLLLLREHRSNPIVASPAVLFRPHCVVKALNKQIIRAFSALSGQKAPRNYAHLELTSVSRISS